MHHNADCLVALTFLDYHFSTILQLLAYQYPSDQLLLLLPVLSWPLLSVV
jgi:hypothetical protein